MKKLFFFAAAIMTAMTINAQTIVFTADDVADQAAFPTSKVFQNEGLVLTVTNEDWTEKDGKQQGKFAVDESNTKFGTEENYVQYTHRLKTGGKSSAKTAMKLTVPAAGKLSVCVRSGSGSEARPVVFTTTGGTELFNKEVADADATTSKIYPVYTFDVPAGDIDITFPNNSVNFYAIEFVASGTTGLESVTEASKAVKVIENGQIYILKNGVKYNMLGAQVAE